MKITALIHTRNEISWIDRCLESVAWADEVIVADMASTDGTRETVTAHGARLIDMPQVPNVDSVRNLALAECTGEWILVVDADERVPSTLALHLREFVISPDVAAIALPRRNLFLGVWLEHGYWPDYQVRFLRRGKASWSGTLHEAPAIDGRIQELEARVDLALDHPGYGQSLSRFVGKHLHYSDMMARQLADTTKPAIWPYIIRRPLSEFLGRYLSEGSWRYGMHGLVWSILQSMYQFLIAVHYWDHQRSTALSMPSAVQIRRGVRHELIRTLFKWFYH